MADKKSNEVDMELYNRSVFEDGDSLVVDLSNIEEQKFEAIPKGIYDAVIDSCEYEISKSSQKPMFHLMFEIASGQYQGRKLHYYLSFSPKALSGTKTGLLRIDPTLFNGPFKPQEIANNGVLLGKALRIKVTHEDYNGEPQARVQTIYAPTEGGTASGGDSFFGG